MDSPVICPTITAYEPHQYREQVERVVGFAGRLHIDLMDGEFTETTSPPVDQIWLPEHVICDVHLMYQRPLEALPKLIELKPHLVVVQAEADDAEAAVLSLKQAGIKAGVALLAETQVDQLGGIIEQVDHVLVFSGHLGYHGGEADLSLLSKVAEIKARNQSAEIAWDGGINQDNAPELVKAGVTVLNAGGFIQNAADPANAYAILSSSVQVESKA